MDSPSQSKSIPEGYTVFIHDGEQYLVPKFMLPATQLAVDAHRQRLGLDIDKAPGGSKNPSDLPYELLGADKVVIPSDPPLTQRELLGLHAEVKALQQRLGISYKDASHRRYMAEIEKLNGYEEIHKISAIIKGRTQKALELFKTNGSDDADADADADQPVTAGEKGVK